MEKMYLFCASLSEPEAAKALGFRAFSRALVKKSDFFMRSAFNTESVMFDIAVLSS